jgi:hypothetical protein
MTGTASVGAPFKLRAMFGIGRLGRIEETSLISPTSQERRTRPHMARINHASKRELCEMIHGGLLGRTAKRLSRDQLDLVIERCRKMLIRES